MHFVARRTVIEQIHKNYEDLKSKEVSNKNEAFALVGKLEAYRKIAENEYFTKPIDSKGWTWIGCDFLNHILEEIDSIKKIIETTENLGFEKDKLKGRLDGYTEIIDLLQYSVQ